MLTPETRTAETDQRPPLLERYRSSVDGFMRSFLARFPGPATAIVEYHLGYKNQDGSTHKEKSDGKALRPTLCLMTVETFGGEWLSAVPAAAAIELFHNYTLIHDDILDNDHMRHGKPTVWSIWGQAQGINAGDIASGISSLALLELEHNGYPAQKVLEAVQSLVQTGLRVINGQVQDVSFEGRRNVSIREYLEMIGNKTGALIETSVLMGADLADVDVSTREHLSSYAQYIGRAFQISDDLLGIWGNERETGKGVGVDIIKRKQSYPVALAFAQADPLQIQKLERIYAQDKPVLDGQDVALVMSIFEEMRIKEQTQEMLASLYSQAVASVQSCNIEDGLPDYLQIAKSLTFRNK